jgi:hypothetical protein
MSLSDFSSSFEGYVRDISDARARRVHHDTLRHLFLSFIQDAFETKPTEFELEKGLKAVRVRGFIDALYEALIFEFKPNLQAEREDAKEELSRYIASQPDPKRYFGIVTDGLGFEVYAVRDDDLVLIDEIDLRKVSAKEALVWFDAYLFKEANVAPTAQDVVRRYGENSAVFNASLRWLQELYESVDREPAVRVKYGEWKSLLAKVYGVPIGTTDLFLRHTYLTYLARTLVFAALVKRRPANTDLAGIVDGKAFRKMGFPNLAEQDFFTWVLESTIVRDVVAWMRGLSQHLITYDLARIDEDLLKELYQELVDPEARHDLGEYYTPDWIAELILEEVRFSIGQTLLDPACGSGTFLFTAIRRLKSQGLKGRGLIEAAFRNLVGVDVHPLAVTIAKANFLLALAPEFENAVLDLPPVPLYLADSLITPDAKKSGKPISIKVPGGASFQIPHDMARDAGVLDEIVDRMYGLASRPDQIDPIKKILGAELVKKGYGIYSTFWMHNIRVLRDLLSSHRDTVWPFVLKNAYRPVFLAERKFDLVVGNPPWLIYRNIEDEAYQRQVRDLVFSYGLLERKDVKLFNEMEAATTFFVHSMNRYLKDDGVIAFVMPKSVLTGAKQHLRFQQLGFSKVFDLEGVVPIFNVPASIIVRSQKSPKTSGIPLVELVGRLPHKNVSLTEASALLTETAGKFEPFEEQAVRSSYHSLFKEGSSLVPRAFWFVRPAARNGVAVVNPRLPYLESDPALEAKAKKPWKGVHLEGNLESEFLYATLLSSHLLPFKYRSLNLVVLPIEPTTKASSDGSVLIPAERAAAKGYTYLARWLEEAEGVWQRKKKKVNTRVKTIYQRLDYEHGLTQQRVKGTYFVFYTTSGTHIAACVLRSPKKSFLKLGPLEVQGVVADFTTYYYQTQGFLEAHYLTAILNSRAVDEAIKKYQPVGLFGARHITRRPFEYLNIPDFDKRNRAHKHLASLSIRCHSKLRPLRINPTTSTAGARNEIRGLLKNELFEIDVLVQTVVGLTGGRTRSKSKESKPDILSLFQGREQH